MKKALALTLALTMLLSLAACGDKPSSSATPPHHQRKLFQRRNQRSRSGSLS